MSTVQESTGCVYCGGNNALLQRNNLRPRTRAVVEQIGIAFPACTQCFNAKYGQRSLENKGGTAASAFRNQVHHFLCRVRGVTKKDDLQQLTDAAAQLREKWRVFEVLWRTLQSDIDRISALPPRPRKQGRPAVLKTISLLNACHSELCTAAWLLSAHVSLDYRKDRKEADLQLRKEWFRNSIFVAADFKCSGCGGTDALQIDHCVPVIRGGATERENLQVLCLQCNAAKGASL